tara:strand:- start:75 stop:686 length:612 start_codon:yes stop_codon:yes gene_type:complete
MDKFKLKSGNKTSFKQMGSSPLKQSYPSSAQKGPHGPKGTLDEVKRIAGEKATKATKAANAKKYGMESLNKAINKRLKPDPQLTFKKKLSTPKVSKKKIAKKVLGKAASRLIPGAGWALAGHDVYKIGKKMKGGHSLKEAVKSHYLGIEKSSPAKEKGKVKTTMSRDRKTITKSKGDKSSTYTVDPKNPKKYVNPKGREIFLG